MFGLLLLAAIAILGLDLLKAKVKTDRDGAIGLALVGAYLVASFAAYIHSLAIISPLGATVGLLRFLFAFPVFLAAMVYIHSLEDLKRCMVSITVVVALLYLSVPWQIAFGQLSWLPSEYKRGGFERYASLLGNVTAVGIAVGFYLAPALFLVRNVRLRLILVVALLISSAASLSKAAIMNALLVPAVAFLQGFVPSLRVWQTWRKSDVFMVVAIFLLSIALVLAIPSVRDRMLVNLASYGIESAEKADDVSIGRSVLERVLLHPKNIISSLNDRYEEYGLISGAGFGMSSTALVPETDSLSTMAHNQYVDFLAIGGVFHMILFILIISYIGYRIVCSNIEEMREGRPDTGLTTSVMFNIFVIFLINLPFANGLVYQPLQASVFWLLMAVSCQRNMRPDQRSIK